MINLGIIVLYIIINIICGFINLRKTLWIDYLIILAFPLDLFNKINIDYLVHYGSISIIDITLFSMFILIFIKKYLVNKIRVKVSIVLILTIIMLIGYCVTLINSFSQYGKLALIDSFQYFKFILIFFISLNYFNKRSINRFIKFTLIGVFINSVILILVYVFVAKNFMIDRYSFGNESMYIFTIPVQLYMLLNSKKYNIKYRLFISIAVILQSILMVFAQNRTNPIVILFLILVLILFDLIYKKHNILRLFKKFSKIIIAFIIIIIGLISINQNYSIVNSDFITRFSELSSSGYNNSYTYEIRKSSNKYYNNLTKSNLLGYGFGTYMPHVLPDGRYESDSLDIFQTDNLLVVYAYKLGIFNTIIFILFIIIFYIKLFVYYIKYKKIEYAIFIIVLPFFYIGTGYMTSQLIHNSVIVVFLWTLIGLINNNRRDNIE